MKLVVIRWRIVSRPPLRTTFFTALKPVGTGLSETIAAVVADSVGFLFTCTFTCTFLFACAFHRLSYVDDVILGFAVTLPASFLPILADDVGKICAANLGVDQEVLVFGPLILACTTLLRRLDVSTHTLLLLDRRYGNLKGRLQIDHLTLLI